MYLRWVYDFVRQILMSWLRLEKLAVVHAYLLVVVSWCSATRLCVSFAVSLNPVSLQTSCCNCEIACMLFMLAYAPFLLLQVFDHHYHFDHLLDTAYEVEEGYTTGHSPLEAASPLSSQGDLSDLGGQEISPNSSCCPHIVCPNPSS